MSNQHSRTNAYRYVPCENCGHERRYKLSVVKRNERFFCTMACKGEYLHKKSLSEIDYIKNNLTKDNIDDFLNRYGCNIDSFRKRLCEYRKIDKAVPILRQLINGVKVKKKNKPKPKPKKIAIKKPPRPPKKHVVVFKNQRPQPQKFPTRTEDMTNKHYVKIDNRTWALRRKTA